MNLSEIFPDNAFHRFWDTVSIGTLFGTLVGWLPHIASLLTVIWISIRIWETPTVQKLFGRNSDSTKR